MSPQPAASPPSPAVRLLRRLRRPLRPLRRLLLRLERRHLAARMSELRGLLDVPHEIADGARTRVERLARRDRALSRLMG